MARNTSLSLRNAVIYQIFTRNYKGGTFQAVEADLDRIQALGADIIYLLPVQPSGEVHRKGSMGSPMPSGITASPIRYRAPWRTSKHFLPPSTPAA